MADIEMKNGEPNSANADTSGVGAANAGQSGAGAANAANTGTGAGAANAANAGPAGAGTADAVNTGAGALALAWHTGQPRLERGTGDRGGHSGGRGGGRGGRGGQTNAGQPGAGRAPDRGEERSVLRRRGGGVTKPGKFEWVHNLEMNVVINKQNKIESVVPSKEFQGRNVMTLGTGNNANAYTFAAVDGNAAGAMIQTALNATGASGVMGMFKTYDLPRYEDDVQNPRKRVVHTEFPSFGSQAPLPAAQKAADTQVGRPTNQPPAHHPTNAPPFRRPEQSFGGRAGTRKCANCGGGDHILVHCAKADEQTGLIGGCVKCNKMNHTVDQCTILLSKDDGYRFDWIVTRRINLPGVQFTEGRWEDLAYGYLQAHPGLAKNGLPWSREFTRRFLAKGPWGRIGSHYRRRDTLAVDPCTQSLGQWTNFHKLPPIKLTSCGSNVTRFFDLDPILKGSMMSQIDKDAGTMDNLVAAYGKVRVNSRSD
ncbi:hypothetical protein B0I35DRAFT_403223 [Stachybotrys elegans]|uniref:CCHC-type domain-containing protein n=1 Tax=Stachybotrys elegans TaxID=80388 RepID=A0A8K0T622_9HYPO|nr:hypothetical protein B0I35DRAFT_403223 [Stachybotrys elegans]